jgi:hypothetical protein
VSERRRRRYAQLVDDVGKEKELEIERGSTRSHFVMNWLWKRLWTGCEDRVRNE